MAAGTASTSSPSHSRHPQNFSSPETSEPRAKRLRTDSDVAVHQIRGAHAGHHHFQADDRSVHSETQSYRRERTKLSEDDNLGGKLGCRDSTEVISVKSSTAKPSGVFVQEIEDGSPPLPTGKKYHIFISHSTADKDKVNNNPLFTWLTESCGFLVKACYHFLHGSYDSNYISQALIDSCVIIIALSKSYCDSQRCTSERQQAARMVKEKKCLVIVAQIEPCSRPDEIRHFLHLDFMDSTKQKAVWDKLLETINHYLPPRLCEPLDSQHDRHQKEEKCISGNPEDSEQAEVLERDQTSFLTSEVKTSKMTETVTPDEGGTSGDGFDENDSSRDSSDEDGSGIGRDGFHRYQDQCGYVEDSNERDDTSRVGEGSHSIHSAVDVTSVSVTSEDKLQGNQLKEEECKSDATASNRDTVSDDEGQSKDMEDGEVSGSSPEMQDDENQAQKVTNFYNKLAEPNADKRNESPIFHMRNFNNWVKSILIRTYLPKRATVLDLCCGKGGDLLKWKEGNIEYLVCADISDASVDQCQERYYSSKMTVNHCRPYGAEFLVADCTENRLREKYGNPGRRFHLTSCQFSLHYAFESYKKAHMMLRNACENLIPGGYFIGTTVDSNELVRKLREAGPQEDGTYQIGNDIFSVKADFTLSQSLDQSNGQPVPLFGAKYNFWLHEVVDLPEYLIHMPLLHRMLTDFGMELITQQNFHDFFTDHRHKREDLDLLFKMRAFSQETGTLSAAQWEVIGLYLVFVYQRKSHP